MRPAFTKALYYPSIDIENSDWLKTAILFWDSLSTIVPESMNKPYQEYDSQYLADNGLLTPFYVNSDSNVVVDIENDIIEMINTPEFMSTLHNPQGRYMRRIFNSKMSPRLIREMERLYDSFGIHNEKLSYRLKDYFKGVGHSFYHGEFYFEEGFSYLYMLTLANKISEKNSIALITDEIASANFTNSIRLGNTTSFARKDIIAYIIMSKVFF